MTAPHSEPTRESNTIRPATAGAAEYALEQLCQTVVDGRRAGRSLAGLCKQFSLSEAEFEVLWCIRLTGGHGIDQATIASRLLLSPAQVSATVERLRSKNWIAQRSVAHDRRRHLWQLSEAGAQLVERFMAEFALARSEAKMIGLPTAARPAERKEAA